MGEGSAGPAATAAAAASTPAAASVAPKASPVEYVVLDLTNEQEIRRVAGVFTGKTREEAVAKAIESSLALQADAEEKELALLPIARRLYDAAVKVKAETVPAKTELRFRS